MPQIVKGNSSPNITVVGRGVTFTDPDYSAKVYVIDGNTTMITADMTKVDSTKFSVQLSPAQTATLSVKDYTLAVVVKNDALLFKQEVTTTITVIASKIPA